MRLRTTYLLTQVPVFLLIPAFSLPQIAHAQSTTQPSIVGQYQARHGDPAKDSYASVMTLDLKSDGTMTSTLTMADPANPGQTVEKKVQGTWTQSGDTVKVTADTLDGQPVETNNPRKTLTLTVKDGGKQLTSDGGPQFSRQ